MNLDNALELISAFGDVMVQSSRLVLGAPESMLNAERTEIWEAFTSVFEGLRDEKSRDQLGTLFPKSLGCELDEDSIQAVRDAFLVLPNFIADADAELCNIYLLDRLFSDPPELSKHDLAGLERVRASTRTQIRQAFGKDLQPRPLTEAENVRFSAIRNAIRADHKLASSIMDGDGA